MFRFLGKITGVINGGKYGTDRAISNNDDENDSSSLGTNKTVASYFFIYLCAYFVQNDEKPYLLPYFIINHVLM